MGNIQDTLSSESNSVDIWDIPSLAKKRPRMPPFATRKGKEGASSSTSSEVEKGLCNPPGHNNCFLNVVIQALWHVEAFRETLMYKPHEHPEGSSPKELENCIYCALQSLFFAYNFSSPDDATPLPPRELRRALSALYERDQRFQEGAMDDAAELLEVLLKYMHADHLYVRKITSGTQIEDLVSHSCMPKSCVSHCVFGFNFVEQRICQQCRATSNPEVTQNYVHRIYVSEITSVYNMLSERMPAEDITLSVLLNSLARNGPAYSCPSSEEKKTSPCPRRCTITKRHLISSPCCLALNLIWASGTSSKSQVTEVVRRIPLQIRLSDLFETSASKPSLGRLKGLVCFYGRHYIAFFCSLKHSAWYLFDDKTVKIVGHWHNVLKRLVNGKLQPVLLFYELLDVNKEEEKEEKEEEEKEEKEEEEKEEEEEEEEEEEKEEEELPQTLKVTRTPTPKVVPKRQLRVRCPSDAKPGTKIQVNWRGRSFSTNIPDGVVPGQTFQVTTTASEKSESSKQSMRENRRVKRFITDSEAKSLSDPIRCSVCTKEYDFIIRRAHHCRQCRRSVCGSCSRDRWKEKRVCAECFDLLDNVSRQVMYKTAKLLRDKDNTQTPLLYIEGVIRHQFGEGAFDIMKADIVDTWRRFALNSMVSQGQEIITISSTYAEIRVALVKIWGEETVNMLEVDLEKYIEKIIKEKKYLHRLILSARQSVSSLVRIHGSKSIGWSHVRRSLLETIGKAGYEKIKFRIRADLGKLLKEFEHLSPSSETTQNSSKDEEEEKKIVAKEKEIYLSCVQSDEHERCALFLSDSRGEDSHINNVVVVQLDDASRHAGIELLDIVLEVDGSKVESAKKTMERIEKSMSNFGACVLKMRSSYRIREEDWICKACTYRMNLSGLTITRKNSRLNLDRVTRCMYPNCDQNFTSFFGLSKSPKHECERCGTAVCVEHAKKNIRDGVSFRCKSCYEERKLVTTCEICKTRR